MITIDAIQRRARNDSFAVSGERWTGSDCWPSCEQWELACFVPGCLCESGPSSSYSRCGRLELSACGRYSSRA